MMEFKFTEEEIEILREYRQSTKLMINQLLISNSIVDVTILRNETEDMQNLSYDRENVRINLENMIRIYEIMLKAYFSKQCEAWGLAYSTTITETERLKNEIYIDYFLNATTKQEEFKRQFETDIPAIINFAGEVGVPYLNIDEALNIETNTPEILIAPFTKIKDFKQMQEIELEDGKKLPIYNVALEKQDLQELTFEEKEAVYNYILTSADVVNQKLQECVEYEIEISENNENIRKLELLLSKYELEIKKKIEFQDYPEIEQAADNADIERIKNDINDLRDSSSNMFEEKKMALDFITKWKKNIAVYQKW